ncbi:aminoacyl-tRNA hydrolase [Bacillus piscicola]|uniref:aminoacyl-tRNA hydrolase n=1 Tax=Bacillus piscicola TaxID=1632684 RepID=UPI001F09FDE2
MKVIAGLGNPGTKYERTRHNVGFDALDILAEELGLSWKKSQKSLLIETVENGEKIFLVKPQTFMNLSGHAIQPLLAYYTIKPENLLVIYDDLDLAPGSLRLRLKGGHGGHNGIRSIIDQLGTKEFKRIRIGIGRPDVGDSVTTHVLGTFPPAEREAVQNTIHRAHEAAREWMRTPFADVMNKYNRKD